jgi:hypothetical protein
MIRLWTAAAIVAALLLVLLGRVIPVPPVVTGEEGSRTDLVKTRTDVVAARYNFQQTELAYQRFLATHELTIIPDELRQQADEWEAGGNHQALLAQARDKVRRSIELGQAMTPYALAGEAYFAELRKYDDDLMSWSRTLGAKSEELRRATWPILEWLKKYPLESGGEDREFHPYPASNVVRATALIQQLAPELDSPTAGPATFRRLAMATDELWDAGKNIPSVNRYHDGYFSALRRYDGESLQVAAIPEDPLAGSQTLRAWAIAGLLGLMLAAGVLLFLAPPAFWTRFAPLGAWLRARLAPITTRLARLPLVGSRPAGIK